jgi:hypothetical protein
MDRSENRSAAVIEFFQRRQVANLEELQTVFGGRARMTVFRALRRLGYLSSYSHRGQFYTLWQIPSFDELGLWSFRDIRFSRFGNLLATAKPLVEKAEAGYTAAELENILHVEVKHTLLQLTRRNEISRSRFRSCHIYLSAENGRQRQQQLTREDRQAHAEVGMGLETEVLTDEVKAAIILFFSMLDEKQRRLYAGLEAAKLGHGGDRRIAELLSLDVHTIAKGRKELLDNSVDRDRTRNKGGGRKRVEKKHQT